MRLGQTRHHRSELGRSIPPHTLDHQNVQLHIFTADPSHAAADALEVDRLITPLRCNPDNDAVALLLDQHLEARWGRGFSIIGTPRVKGRFPRTRIGSSYWMDDAAYELNLALDRILFNGTIWLQTREPFQLNRRLLNTYGGGVVMTVNCSTAPGGYSEPTSADPQFPVHSTDEMQGMATLQDDGFTVRSSWGPADLDACCRPARQG